jgi:hypothetical protein
MTSRDTCNASMSNCLPDAKTAIAEAKPSIIIWIVSAIFLAQLLPALLKTFGV